MSLTPTSPPDELDPYERVNELTLLAHGGHDIGVEHGDRYELTDPSGEQVTVKVTEVMSDRCVLQHVGSGFHHYGKHSISELL